MISSCIHVGKDQIGDLAALLKSNNLPFEDIVVENNLFKIYHDRNGKVLGSGGLEFYGGFALLRSVTVIQPERAKSVGRSIVADLLRHARERAIQRVYLLTETAPVFFENIGFNNVMRESVPDAVKSSTEFASVCPVTASCMELIL